MLRCCDAVEEYVLWVYHNGFTPLGGGGGAVRLHITSNHSALLPQRLK